MTHLEQWGCWDNVAEDNIIKTFEPYHYASHAAIDAHANAVAGFKYNDFVPSASVIETRTTTLDQRGFALNLPSERGPASAALSMLEQRDWIDRATRAIVIHLNMVSTNVNLMAHLQIIIEFNVQGHIEATYTVQMMRFTL